MSLPPGKYKITSILEGTTRVPHLDIYPQSLPVSLNLPIDVWTLSPGGGPDAFLFHLGNYPVTGVDSEDRVIVSQKPEVKQVTWYITPVRGGNEYIIKPDYRRSDGWTVVRDPSHNQPVIKLENLGFNPGGTPSQVFRFERV